MVPAALSKLAFWTRANRWKKYAYDPERAPHRPLVSRLVYQHLPPLTLRCRDDNVQDFITRVLLIETSPIPLVEEPLPRQLALLIARAQQVIEQLENDQVILRRQFGRFSETFSRTDDPEQQRGLIAQYLINTAKDQKKLKGDLKAMDRFLGFDVLRERNATELAHVSVTIEAVLEFIGQAGATCLTSDEPGRPSLSELLDQTQSGRFLSERLEKSDRWQARLAAGEALMRLYQAGTRDGGAVVWDDATGETRAEQPAHEADERRLARERRLRVLETIERCARNVEDHAWVQAKALEILLILDTQRAREVLNDRLFGEKPADVRTDFLLRRLAVGLAGRYLRVLNATSLLLRMIDRPDPSEYVRMGVCEALTQLPPPAAISALMRVLGVDGSQRDKSNRVRAAAVISLSRIVADGELDAGAREGVVETLAKVLETDTDSLVLEVTCAELPAIADTFRRIDQDLFTNQWKPRWKAALKRAVCSDKTPPRMSDNTAATIDVLDRHSFPDRLAFADYLAPLLADIRPGKRRLFPWSDFPPEALPVARNPMVMGRCLSELSREDYGLCARITRRGLVIWRGDIFRWRLWRVCHEVRNPGPNKRQGYKHTWGRCPQGDLRAPPARMDEVTPTTVPGERTHVDEAGGWGRHFPMVDDVLDVPLLRRKPVHIFSSHGVTTVLGPRSLRKRLWNRLWLSWKYRIFATLRMGSLAATEPNERHRFVQTVAERLGVEITFRAYDEDEGVSPHKATSMRILTLFRGKAAVAAAEAATAAETAAAAGAATETAAGGAAATALLVPLMDRVHEWIGQHGPYFLSLSENSQTALALFLFGFLSWFLVMAHFRRRRLARAREGIPLSIGGWGTRGKSGTERLKGGLFHGLGYHVLAKTTGCEAMFINAQPGQEATEIFLYRAYDKATIWEQADVLALAEGVGADVFLWECMALNPRYVELLQHDWMQDDLITLTNAYPDHEDIQGPAGCDVAGVISSFIPRKGILITSETNFLPLFRHVARERKTECNYLSSYAGDLIAGDVLELFPYSEHPRNIALVGRMAEKAGIERELAIITMAQNVVPDLGVLKSYGPATVRGRNMTFICGNSANERTGFLNNWRRTGMDKLDADTDPESLVITVVNNRADRIARSKVFADILVFDTAVDRHVLIGTNLKGLRSYFNTALDQYLSDKRLVQDIDFEEPDPLLLPMTRLVREMKRFRIPQPVKQQALVRFALYATGARLHVAEADMAELGNRLDAMLAAKGDEPVTIEEVMRSVQADSGFMERCKKLLAEARPKDDVTFVEALEPPTHDDIIHHFVEIVSRMLIRARLEAQLRTVIATRAGIDKFHDDFKAAYRSMSEKSLEIVHDPMTSGDKIIEICAMCVPPGTKVSLMGTQNIKGTGLDFVYRWIYIDKVQTFLSSLKSNRAEHRITALNNLEGFEDQGLYGSGTARAALSSPSYTALSPQEDSLRQRVLLRVESIYKQRLAKVQSAGTQQGGKLKAKVISILEATFDYLDSIYRRRASRQIMDDVIHQRISLSRAAVEMRILVARQKGGWLAKLFSRKK